MNVAYHCCYLVMIKYCVPSDFAHSLKSLCLYLLDHMLKQDKGLKMTIAYRFLS